MALHPLQTTFDVTVDGDTYTFDIPTITFDIVVGYKAADVRGRAYPDSGGVLNTIDFAAANFSRYCAYLELYLRKASTLWPYGYEDDDLDKVDFNKPPQVDFLKFPTSRADDVYLVGAAFDTEYARFRRRRNRPAASVREEAVAGERNPGASQSLGQAAD
jgi:hypothetical protein